MTFAHACRATTDKKFHNTIYKRSNASTQRWHCTEQITASSIIIKRGTTESRLYKSTTMYHYLHVETFHMPPPSPHPTLPPHTPILLPLPCMVIAEPDFAPLTTLFPIDLQSYLQYCVFCNPKRGIKSGSALSVTARRRAIASKFAQ